MRRLFALLLVGAVLPIGAAQAGGYDTPIMYSARHMGMGGTAIGYVNDPSATFHNPAGLAHTNFLDVTLDFSPLLGKLDTSPSYADQNKKSNLTFAPFFLGSVSLRVTDFLVLGVGIYPVASSGASYDYVNGSGIKTHDETRISFIEVAPGLAVNLPLGFKFGAVWRATMLQFRRLQESPGSGSAGMFDMDLSGASFAGYRVGLQWSYLPWLSAGLVYRSRTDTTVEADKSVVLTKNWGKTTMPFILPAKLGAGVRADLGPFGAAVDLEYGLYSENDTVVIKGANPDPAAKDLELTNYYMWSDAITLRLGLEYAFLPLMKARIGYVYDGKVGDPNYPTAFGTPPTHTQSITAGFGASLFGFVEANLAYAYRFGSATVGAPAAGTNICLGCSKPGDYAIGLHGIYADVGLKF